MTSETTGPGGPLRERGRGEQASAPTSFHGAPTLCVTGRTPFPRAALAFATPVDAIDLDTIARSRALGAAFHGVVELRYKPFATSQLEAVLEPAGWKILEQAPVSQHVRGWAAARAKREALA